MPEHLEKLVLSHFAKSARKASAGQGLNCRKWGRSGRQSISSSGGHIDSPAQEGYP